MKELKSRSLLIYDPETGEKTEIDIFRGESAYEAAVRLGLTTLTEDEWVKEYNANRDAAIAAIEAKAAEALASIPEDYTQIQEDVNQLSEEIADLYSLANLQLVPHEAEEKLDANYHVFRSIKDGESYAFKVLTDVTFTTDSVKVGTHNAAAYMVDTLVVNPTFEAGKDNWVYYLNPYVQEGLYRFVRIIPQNNAVVTVECYRFAEAEEIEERLRGNENSIEESFRYIAKNVAERNVLTESFEDSMDELKYSVESLATLRINENSFEKTVKIPASLAYHKGVARFALHYGAFEGVDVYNEVFFEKNCSPDFSDVRFFDADGNMLDSVIETRGNYDFIKDNNLKGNSVSPTLHLSDGTLVGTNSSSYPCISDDNGLTWTVLPGASDIQATAFFVDAAENIYASGRISGTSAYNKVYKFYASTNYATSKIVLDWSSYTSYAYVYNLGAAEDDKGYIYFGRYQLSWDYGASLFRSTDGGETFSECYHDENRQHIHGVSVDKNTSPWIVYVGIDNSNTNIGPACVRSTDNGETWEDVPIPYKNKDYFCYHGSGYHLGGGEANILGGYTVYKTTDPMNADVYKPVANTSQGVRTIMSPKDGIILYGGCAGDTNCIDQICMSNDDGETWRTVYAEDWDSIGGSGNGVRWFTDYFTPKGASEQQVIINGNSRQYGIRGYFGGDRHYAVCYVNLKSSPITPEYITVKCGYAMEYPRKKYRDVEKQIDGASCIFHLPLREGNGNYVQERISGKVGKIVGDFEWCDAVGNRKDGFAYPKNRVSGNALKLDENAYVNMGNISTINKNKDFTIAFKLNTESPNGLFSIPRKHVVLSNDAFELALFENRRFGILWKDNNTFTRAYLHLGAIQTDYHNMYFVTVSADDLPTVESYVNDSAQVMEAVTATSWGTGLFSSGDLYLGSVDGNSIGYQISDLMIFDKVLSSKEMERVYHGCYFEARD